MESRVRKNTENQVKSDEKRGKGELMIKSVLGGNKRATSYLRQS